VVGSIFTASQQTIRSDEMCATEAYHIPGYLLVYGRHHVLQGKQYSQETDRGKIYTSTFDEDNWWDNEDSDDEFGGLSNISFDLHFKSHQGYYHTSKSAS
jgi:hypothetical protein